MEFKGIKVKCGYPFPHQLERSYQYICMYDNVMDTRIMNNNSARKIIFEKYEMFDFLVSALQESYKKELSWYNYILQEKILTKEGKKYFKIRAFDFECYDEEGYEKRKEMLEEIKTDIENLTMNKLNVLVGRGCVLVEIE